MDLIYRELTAADGDKALVHQVALLHDQEFRNGLGASLGTEFAHAFYRDVIHSGSCFLIAALQGPDLAGYIAAVYDNRAFPTPRLRRLIKILALRRMLTCRLHYVGLIRRLRNRYLGRAAHGMAELLSVQVCQGYQGKGIGRALVGHMARRLSARGVGAYCVYTDDPGGVNFYERLGLRPLFKTAWLGVPSACFVKTLSAQGARTGCPLHRQAGRRCLQTVGRTVANYADNLG